MSAGVVIPIRAFAEGKSRLSSDLSPSERSELLQWMAKRVVAASGRLPVAIVSSATEVRQWAARRGLDIIDDPGTLNEAAERGVAWARHHGYERVVIAHADLPFARDLDRLAIDAPASGVLAVRSHRDEGTPVLSVSAGLAFQFSYGPGSFQRHEIEAGRLGVGFHAVDNPALAFDVDSIDDLLATAEAAAELQREPHERPPLYAS